MSSLPITMALLLGSAIVIYLACEYFVNGVEWVGEKFDVGQKATGTILAAFGTALPESVVTLVAVAFGTSAAARELGVGAALGGPLALSTIAYATVGMMLLLTGRRLATTQNMAHVFKRISADQGWFLAIFAAKIGLGLLAFAWKPWLGLLFLAAYVLYVRQELSGEGDDAEEGLEPLKFQPGRTVPTTVMAVAQTTLALVVIFVASRIFVAQLEELGPALGLRPQLLALLLSPIATELPETMNAVIWVRQGRFRLALANISGAMMIQATIPTALGLFFTPWLLTPPLLVAAGATMLAILIMFLVFRRGRASRRLLACMGLFYLAFAAIIAAFHLG